MDSDATASLGRLLRLARTGQTDALGQLLEAYRQYLTLLARLQIGQRLQGKVDASDLVQETFMEAHRGFQQFRGSSQGELLGWLRQILVFRLAKSVRHYCGTQRRDVRLERRLEGDVDRSSQRVCELVGSASSPSQRAVHHEQSVLLADVLGRLPADYREVIVLRHFEDLTFPEVARRMGRSEDAVKKTWARALTRIRHLIGASGNE